MKLLWERFALFGLTIGLCSCAETVKNDFRRVGHSEKNSDKGTESSDALSQKTGQGNQSNNAFTEDLSAGRGLQDGAELVSPRGGAVL